jgi:predicted small secreted protein
MNFHRLPTRCLLLVAAFVLLSGCNTVRGVGRDVERAGEVIQGRSAQLAPTPVVDAAPALPYVAR